MQLGTDAEERNTATNKQKKAFLGLGFSFLQIKLKVVLSAYWNWTEITLVGIWLNTTWKPKQEKWTSYFIIEPVIVPQGLDVSSSNSQLESTAEDLILGTVAQGITDFFLHVLKHKIQTLLFYNSSTNTCSAWDWKTLRLTENTWALQNTLA